MNVEELLQRLSFAELSGLSLSNEGDGTVEPEDQNKLIMYANEGLLRLYSRFVLLQRVVQVRILAGRGTYNLSTRFAETNLDRAPLDPPYVLDAGDPFTDDVIKILEVDDECGRTIPLNDKESRNSIMTPYNNVMQVSRPITPQILHVTYQASHPKLRYGVMGSQIYVPDTLEKALRAYIASEVFGNMNGEEHLNKSAKHLAIYEGICAEAVDRDLVNSGGTSAQFKFGERGFI